MTDSRTYGWQSQLTIAHPLKASEAVEVHDAVMRLSTTGRAEKLASNANGVFEGFARKSVTNGTTAGQYTIPVYPEGLLHELASNFTGTAVAQTSVGATVYMTGHDKQFTLDATGNAIAIGKIAQVNEGATEVVIHFRSGSLQ